MKKSTGPKALTGCQGGINAETAPRVVKAGGRVLVAGSAVFSAGKPIRETMQKIRNSLI